MLELSAKASALLSFAVHENLLMSGEVVDWRYQHVKVLPAKILLQPM